MGWYLSQLQIFSKIISVLSTPLHFAYSLSNLERVSPMKRFARQASPPHSSIEEGSEREDLNNDETNIS